MTRTNLGIRASSRINATSLSAAILALSPVGYWRLNETTGTTAADSSGNARNGTYIGSLTLAGQNGHVVLSGGYVEVPDNDAFSIGTASGLSVFALVRPSANVTFRSMFVSKGANSQFEWDLQSRLIATDNSIDAQAYVLSGGSATATERTDAAVLAPAAWQAIACDFPQTLGARFSIWRNNSTALATFNGGTAGSVANGTAPVQIGARMGVFAFSGAMAHVALFPGRLNSTQIGTLMSAAQAEGWF